MPFPNEHAARVKDESQCGKFRRTNQGSGVSLILCELDGKMTAVSYRFKKDNYTPEQAKEWLKKHDIKFIEFTPAGEGEVKAKITANKNKTANGRIWSKGKHHVYVNDKPATIYVPETTIMDTFKSIRELIHNDGRMPIGIDHLNDETFNDNGILKKLNLLDIGSVNKVGTDGTSIYVLDSKLDDDIKRLHDLHDNDELSGWSIVGNMDAKRCTKKDGVDYVVNSIIPERVDFVEEGGCQVCKVGSEPDTLILTSKKNKQEVDNMVEQDDAKPTETVEEVSNEADNVEVVEEKPEEIKEQQLDKVNDKQQQDTVVQVNDDDTETSDDAVVTVEDKGASNEDEEQPTTNKKEGVEPDITERLEALEKENNELREQVTSLGGKKPPIDDDVFDAENAVSKLIKDGRALPKMKDSLINIARADPEAFNKLAASMPRMVVMETKAKLSRVQKEEREQSEAHQQREAEKEMARKYFGVELD